MQLDAIARRMHRLVLRTPATSLVYVWCDDDHAQAWLADELERALAQRSRRLRRLALPDDEQASAGQLAEPLVEALLMPSAQESADALWLDLRIGQREAPARERGAHARAWLLARCNERRAQLLAPGRPVVLVCDTLAEFDVAATAPDLWTIRASAYTVGAASA